MSNTVSGKLCIKILCRHFGFFIASQKGSHIKLRKRAGSKTITTVVPTHYELAPGTLHGILKLGEIEDDEFWKNV